MCKSSVHFYLCMYVFDIVTEEKKRRRRRRRRRRTPSRKASTHNPPQSDDGDGERDVGRLLSGRVVELLAVFADPDGALGDVALDGELERGLLRHALPELVETGAVVAHHDADGGVRVLAGELAADGAADDHAALLALEEGDQALRSEQLALFAEQVEEVARVDDGAAAHHLALRPGVVVKDVGSLDPHAAAVAGGVHEQLVADLEELRVQVAAEQLGAADALLRVQVPQLLAHAAAHVEVHAAGPQQREHARVRRVQRQVELNEFKEADAGIGENRPGFVLLWAGRECSTLAGRKGESEPTNEQTNNEPTSEQRAERTKRDFDMIVGAGRDVCNSRAYQAFNVGLE